MNSYKQSLDLELVGSDDDKVAILQSLTLRDISKDDAGRFLREEKLLKYNGSKWIGTIEDLLDMGRIPSEHVDDIDDLKSVLIGSGGTGLSTSSQKWAAKIAGFVGLLTSITGSTALADKFYDLGGGRPYATLTVEQFEAQAAAAAAAAVKDALREYLISQRQSFDTKYNRCLQLISAGTVTTNGEVLAVVQLELEP